MKVLDLHCQHGHVFEGWFGSEDDFQSQLTRGLVECPLCGDQQITKKLSAPRLNLSTAKSNATDLIAGDAHSDWAQSPKSPQNPANSGSEMQPSANVQVMQAMMRDPEFQAAYLRMARKIIASTEDVGDQFADVARKIHHGETEERAIRGQATMEQTMELLEEGIEVMPLPLPKALKEPLQ
jgi:hypothetical protein